MHRTDATVHYPFLAESVCLTRVLHEAMFSLLLLVCLPFDHHSVHDGGLFFTVNVALHTPFGISGSWFDVTSVFLI